jgi:hypothetical protein
MAATIPGTESLRWETSGSRADTVASLTVCTLVRRSTWARVGARAARRVGAGAEGVGRGVGTHAHWQGPSRARQNK